MNKLKEHFKYFIKEDDGMETMEWAILLVIVIGIIVVAMGIADKLKAKIEEAGQVLDGLTLPSSPGP